MTLSNHRGKRVSDPPCSVATRSSCCGTARTAAQYSARQKQNIVPLMLTPWERRLWEEVVESSHETTKVLQTERSFNGCLWTSS